MKLRWAVIFVLALAFLAAFMSTAKAENPKDVEVGVLLVNIEKVDLAANSYRLDFYLWFRFNPSDISVEKVRV